MRKDHGIELLARVAQGARRGDTKEVAERVKNFIEGILQRQFMTSQEHQTETAKREQALPREVLRTLPTASDYDGALQTGAHLRQEYLFFFCSITNYLQEFYC